MNQEQEMLFNAAINADYDQVLSRLQAQPELLQDSFFNNALLYELRERIQKANPESRAEYSRITHLLQEKPFPELSQTQRETTASITATDHYGTNSYDELKDIDAFNPEINARRFSKKPGVHGDSRTYDYDNGRYLPEETVPFLKEMSQPSQQKKKAENLSPYPIVKEWEWELYSSDQKITPGKTLGIPYYAVKKPFDITNSTKINWSEATAETHFSAGSEYRIIVPYTRMLDKWLKDWNISHTIDATSGRATIDGTLELNWHRPKAEVSAECGVSVLSIPISLPPIDPFAAFGLIFTPKLSGGFGCGAGIKAGIGAHIDLKNYKCRVYGLMGAFLGVGGSIEPEIDIDVNPELLNRYQEILSTHPLFTDIFPQWHDDLTKNYEQKIEYSNLLTHALGMLEKEIKYSIGNTFIDVLEEGSQNLAALAAFSSTVATWPHYIKSEAKQPEQKSTENQPNTEEIPDFSDSAIPEGIPSMLNEQNSATENAEHSQTFIDKPKELPPSENSEDLHEKFSLNDRDLSSSAPFIAPENPEINLENATHSAIPPESIAQDPTAILPTQPESRPNISRTHSRATRPSVPVVDVVEKSESLLGEQIADHFNDYVEKKIKQDAYNASLQAPPSAPQQKHSGFMKGVSFKEDERRQQGIHYCVNHADSDNPHGMKIEFGISYRAIFELFKLVGSAVNRVKNYTQEQKDAYNLMQFISRSDGTEEYCLKFEQRLKQAKFSDAIKNHFKFAFYTGNTEELSNLKEMILDKNAEIHKNIRAKLQNWSGYSTWENDTKEGNLSHYTDSLYYLLQSVAEETKKQEIYQAIGHVLHHPDLARSAIHELYKDSREKTFKDSIEPELKKLLGNYTNAKLGKKAKKAKAFEAFVKKNEDIYYDEMPNYQLQFHRQRAQESDWLKAREILKGQGKTQDADNITHDLAQKNPKNKAYIEQSGIAYAKQGNFEQAILQWQKLDTLSGESKQLLYRQLSQLGKDKKYSEAKKLCEKFMTSSRTADESYDYIHRYVSLCFANNDYATGIAQLEKLLTDYKDDRKKYEETAGIWLNAYGAQAQRNDISLCNLKGEWLDKILNDTAITDINTLLNLSKFHCLQGNNQKAIDCFKQCQINQNEISKDQLKEMNAILPILLDKAMRDGKYDQVDQIEQEVGELYNLPTVKRIFKQIREIRTLSEQCESGRTVEVGSQVGLMVARNFEDDVFRKIAVSIFGVIKGATTALVTNASEWLNYCTEKYSLNRILDSEALTETQRTDYTKQLSDLENKSFLARSGTYHALSSILHTGKMWHEAYYRDTRESNAKEPAYTKLNTLIAASDSIALYLDAQALKLDWDHSISMADVAIQATRLAIDTLLVADQWVEEWRGKGKGFGLKENQWIKEHMPESIRFAHSAVAIAKDLNVTTAAVHGASMLVPHLLPDDYLNPKVAELILKGEYIEGNGYMSLAAVVGGFKGACNQVGTEAVTSAAITVGKAAVTGAMSIPQVATAVAAVGKAATVGSAFVATNATATASAAAAMSAKAAAAVMAIPQVAATGTAIASAAATASTAIAAAGSAIATGASAFGSATGITTAATAVAALGGEVASGAATVGGATYSCISGIGSATGITAAVESAIPILSANATALAAQTWDVVVTVAPVVGGIIVVVGVASVGYHVYRCQYNENTKQFYVNAHIAINEVNFERAAEEMVKYANQTQPEENQFSWTEWSATMTPEALGDYIVSDITKKNIAEKQEQQLKHINAAAEYAKEKVYENTEAHDIVSSIKAGKTLILSELDQAIEKILQHIEKHPSLQRGGDDLVYCEYRKLEIFEKEENNALKNRIKTVNDAIQFLDNPEAEIEQAKKARSAHLDKTQALINQINKHSPYRGYDVFFMETPPAKNTLIKDTLYLYFDDQQLKYVMLGTPEVALKGLSEEQKKAFKEKNSTLKDGCIKLEDYSADYMRTIFSETKENGHTRFYLNKEVRNVPEITEKQKEEKEKDPIMQCHDLQQNSLLPVQYTASRTQTAQLFINTLIQINKFLEYSFSKFDENTRASICIEKFDGKLLYKIKNVAGTQEIVPEDFLKMNIEKKQVELFFEELRVSPDWFDVVKRYKKEILAITAQRGHTSTIIDDNLILLEKFSSASSLIFNLTQLVKTSIERQIACLLNPNDTQTNENIVSYWASILQSQISLITDYHGLIRVLGHIENKEYKQGQEYWKNYILPCLQMLISAATIFSNRHDSWKVGEELSRIFYNLLKAPHLRKWLSQVDQKSLENFNGYFFLGQFLENLDSNSSMGNMLNMNSEVFNYWARMPEVIKSFLTTLISWERYGNRFLANGQSSSDSKQINFSLFSTFSKGKTGPAEEPPKVKEYFERFLLIQQGINIFFSLADTALNYKRLVLKQLIKQSIDTGKKADTAYYYGLLHEHENNISEAIRCYKESVLFSQMTFLFYCKPHRLRPFTSHILSDSSRLRFSENTSAVSSILANAKIKQLSSSHVSNLTVTPTHKASKKEESSSFRRAVMGLSALAIVANPPIAGSTYFIVSIMASLGVREFDRKSIMPLVKKLHTFGITNQWSNVKKESAQATPALPTVVNNTLH